MRTPWRIVRDLGRTVSGHRADSPLPWADGPLIATERSDEHPNARTIRTWSLDGPRATRAVWTVRGLWADGPAHTRTVRDPYADGPTNPFQLETDGVDG
jgi:hypothetical protein